MVNKITSPSSDTKEGRPPSVLGFFKIKNKRYELLDVGDIKKSRIKSPRGLKRTAFRHGGTSAVASSRPRNLNLGYGRTPSQQTQKSSGKRVRKNCSDIRFTTKICIVNS